MCFSNFCVNHSVHTVTDCGRVCSTIASGPSYLRHFQSVDGVCGFLHVSDHQDPSQNALSTSATAKMTNRHGLPSRSRFDLVPIHRTPIPSTLDSSPGVIRSDPFWLTTHLHGKANSNEGASRFTNDSIYEEHTKVHDALAAMSHHSAVEYDVTRPYPEPRRHRSMQSPLFTGMAPNDTYLRAESSKPKYLESNDDSRTFDDAEYVWVTSNAATEHDNNDDTFESQHHNHTMGRHNSSINQQAQNQRRTPSTPLDAELVALGNLDRPVLERERQTSATQQPSSTRPRYYDLGYLPFLQYEPSEANSGPETLRNTGQCYQETCELCGEPCYAFCVCPCRDVENDEQHEATTQGQSSEYEHHTMMTESLHEHAEYLRFPQPGNPRDLLQDE